MARSFRTLVNTMIISESKIAFIRNEIHDQEFNFDLSKKFNSSTTYYRENIRTHLSTQYSSYFSRVQLANLSDLTLIPETSQGYFSISHCQSVGGFSYSNWVHGFDVEVLVRISNPIITRTSSEAERTNAPDIKFLWVAKEAAFKAYGRTDSQLIMTDFICEKWQSHSETGIYSFRITSEKTLAAKINRGFVFSEEDVLLAVYFR